MNGSKRNYMIYGTMLAVFGLLMWWVVRMGEAYDTSDVVAVRHADSSVDLLRETLASNLTHPVPLLLLQIIAILVAVRIFSYLFKYLGQPGVIGEIVAGIVLGPSVLGHFFPGAFEFLFEPSSLVPLNVISQIGLVLFMFVIGMELDLGVVRRKASETSSATRASSCRFFSGWCSHIGSIPSSERITLLSSLSRCSSVYRSASRLFPYWPGSCRSATWAKRRWECSRSPALRTTT